MNRSNNNYRDTILSEATEIGMAQGLSNINIRAVAKSSGVSIGTIYNYFPSKSDLLIAVIEEFWKCAIVDIDWQNCIKGDFYDNLESIYNILYINLRKFEKNWIEELGLLKKDEKLLGRKKESEYFQKIHDRIKMLMDMDNNISQYQWSEVITKENMAEYIFENIMIMLKKYEEDTSFFIGILKKIFSN